MTDLLERVNEQLVEIDRSNSEGGSSTPRENQTGPPVWLPQAKAQLNELRDLQDDWDGHGSLSVNTDVVQTVALILERFPADSVEPWLAATSDGGISIEWSTRITGLILKVEPDETPVLYIAIGGRTWEGPLEDAPSALDDLARDWISPH